MEEIKDIVFYLIVSEDCSRPVISTDQLQIPAWLADGHRVFILGTSKDFDEITKSEIIVEVTRSE